jgi:hypothetical protein
MVPNSQANHDYARRFSARRAILAITLVSIAVWAVVALVADLV